MNDYLDELYAMHKREPMRDIKTLIIRIREQGQPLGKGVTMRYQGDDLDGLDPDHETAIDKVALMISLTMDASGPTLAEWKKE